MEHIDAAASWLGDRVALIAMAEFVLLIAGGVTSLIAWLLMRRSFTRRQTAIIDELKGVESRLLAKMEEMIGKSEPEQRQIFEQVLHMTGSAGVPGGTVLGNLRDRDSNAS